MTSKVTYLGDLRTEAVHIRSQKQLITDAPTDNNGKGEAFSPTDLVATALSSCMLTIMGIVAERKNIDIKGTSSEITKVMTDSPRRIAEINIDIHFPEGADYSDIEMDLLEEAAMNCPVAQSLHPDIEQNVNFHYN